MGKVEDMRRQRELLFAQRERAVRAAAAPAAPGPAAPAAAAASAVKSKVKAKAAEVEADEDADADEEGDGDEAAPARPAGRGAARAAEATGKPAGKIARPARAGRGADEQGTCSVCGKQRPLQGGKISSHQRGFGKVCAGSRKPPAGA